MRLFAPVLLIAAAAPAAVSPALRAALADPARADQQPDDERRQAAAVIGFAGLKPGASVIDFLPGAGYWTRIFTGVVGPKGHVYSYWPQGTEKSAARTLPGLQARGLANVTFEVQQTRLPTPPAPVDLFWTAQNYHDVPEGMTAAFNAAVFAALKPGGVYLVIDHADTRGAPRTEPFKHRIDPAVVRAQVTAAGFRFAGQSTVLANPADDHSKPVFDPSLRGHTDQFVLKFRRPG